MSYKGETLRENRRTPSLPDSYYVGNPVTAVFHSAPKDGDPRVGDVKLTTVKITMNVRRGVLLGGTMRPDS